MVVSAIRYSEYVLRRFLQEEDIGNLRLDEWPLRRHFVFSRERRPQCWSELLFCLLFKKALLIECYRFAKCFIDVHLTAARGGQRRD